MTALPQDLRFCTTRDGVRLAHAATGSGPPLVRAGTWLSHLECDVAEEDSSARIRAFSKRYTYIRYDSRGTGLSDRHIATIQFEDLIADLEAVVQAHKLERFALFGVSMGAAIAIAYAARHPGQVTKLVLMNGFARSYFSAKHVSPAAIEEAELLLKNAQVGWNNAKSVFRHVFMAQLLGDPTPEQQAGMDERMRLSMTADMAVMYLQHNYSIDVVDACTQVKCPAIVFHSRHDEMVNFEQGRKLASMLPDARFIPLEARGHHVLSTEPAAHVFHGEVDRFLSDDGKASGTDLRLTPRQVEVLVRIAKGKTDKQIARELDLSPRTVEMHVAGGLKALGCSTRAEAVHKASQAGLLA